MEMLSRNHPLSSVAGQQFRQRVDIHHHRLTLVVQRRSVATLALEPHHLFAAARKGSDQRSLVVSDRRCFEGSL